jgi:hypothetical protein
MWSSKKWPVKALCRSVYLSEAYSFCLEWSSNFVGSESGQIQSVELLQNMVSNGLDNPPATHCLYILYFWHREGGGRVESERRSEGQQFTKLGRKYQHDLL